MHAVRIRPLKLNDAHAFLPIVTDRVVATAAGFPPIATLAEAKTRLASDIEHQQAFAIDERTTMVGVILLSEQVGEDGMPDTHHLEVAFMLNPAFQKRRIMSTALRLLLQQLQKAGQVHSLIANVLDNNVASKRVLTQVGFTQLGTFYDFESQLTCQFEIRIAK
ncbi:GNAT family N-acetyltransferase [Lactobacillaceae bacterium Melli_B4]